MTVQERINELQVAILGSNPTKDDVAAYFNACLNSAVGVIADRYGDDAAVVMLSIWIATIKQKKSMTGTMR